MSLSFVTFFYYKIQSYIYIGKLNIRLQEKNTNHFIFTQKDFRLIQNLKIGIQDKSLFLSFHILSSGTMRSSWAKQFLLAAFNTPCCTFGRHICYCIVENGSKLLLLCYWDVFVTFLLGGVCRPLRRERSATWVTDGPLLNDLQIND